MPGDSNLEAVRCKIEDLLPLLEEFLQPNYTPVPDDAGVLKEKLFRLMEEVAIYHHYITKKEISSSFHIHAAISKLSEHAEPAKPEKESVTQEEAQNKAPATPNPAANPPAMEMKTQAPQAIPIPLSINDRFLLKKNLFKNSEIEWNSAWQQFALCQTIEEIVQYLESLRELYKWDTNDPAYRILEKACLKKFR